VDVPEVPLVEALPESPVDVELPWLCPSVPVVLEAPLLDGF